MDHALVVEAHKCDHVGDVVVGLDPPSSEARATGEDGVVVNAPLPEQLIPDRLREPEVRRVVAVQMADLASTDLERELAAPAWARRDSWPRSDFLRDSFACSLLVHRSSSPNLPRLFLISIDNELQANMNPTRLFSSHYRR
jgi:hypothetical protein